MPYDPSRCCSPALYQQTQALRARDAARNAERRARVEQKNVADFVEAYGERMSDEAKGLLAGITETLRHFAQVTRR